jgi:hypothetical protein
MEKIIGAYTVEGPGSNWYEVTQIIREGGNYLLRGWGGGVPPPVRRGTSPRRRLGGCGGGRGTSVYKTKKGGVPPPCGGVPLPGEG